jgi:hypothetical protein
MILPVVHLSGQGKDDNEKKQVKSSFHRNAPLLIPWESTETAYSGSICPDLLSCADPSTLKMKAVGST